MKQNTILCFEKLVLLLAVLLPYSLVRAQEVRPFITTWKTTINNEEIIIPTNSDSGPYNYTVDWGDGTPIETNITGDTTHTYAIAGAYKVKITGDFPHIHFNNREGSDKIQAVEQWGDIQWKSMQQAFKGCTYLQVHAADAPNLSEVTNLSEMFMNATSLNQGIGHWEMSNVKNLEAMFNGAIAFNQDIGDWNVSNVTTMRLLFLDATSFNQDIGRWDVSKVTDMDGMFEGAAAFNQDISNWDVSNVLIMRNMFWKAASFNQDIGRWDVSNVVLIAWMFQEATAFNQDISDWDVSRMRSLTGLFKGATSFNQDISSWNMSNIKSAAAMFKEATSFNQDISGWDLSNAITMNSMFEGASAFNQDLGSWTSNAINRHDMFDGSGLDCANYSSTLFGWANNTSTSDIQLGADGMEYGTDVSDKINELITDRNWIIDGHTSSDAKCLPFDIDRELVTGTATPSNTENVHVYPSPAEERLNIVLDSNHGKIQQMVIRALSGQILSRRVVSPGELNEDGVLHLEITNLESGLYFLEIQASGTSSIFRTKFFKQ